MHGITPDCIKFNLTLTHCGELGFKYGRIEERNYRERVLKEYAKLRNL